MVKSDGNDEMMAQFISSFSLARFFFNKLQRKWTSIKVSNGCYCKKDKTNDNDGPLYINLLTT